MDSKFKWSTWLHSGNARKSRSAHREDGESVMEIPWISLSSTPTLTTRSYPSSELDFDSPGTLSSYPRTQPRWVDTLDSPRTPAHGPEHLNGSPIRREANPTHVSAGSTWTLQFIAALALIGFGLYAHTQSTTVARDANQVYSRLFQTDYSATAWPAIVRFLGNHHVSIPAAFTVSQAIHFQVPVRGTVTTDYSDTQSRMLIQATSGTRVEAVGVGSVTKVAKLKDGYMLTIDHGTVGSSQYFGLASVSVVQGQQVQAGQVVGLLPQTQHPTLGFAFVTAGTYKNPHDYIQFSNAGAAT